jgi:hypothetical protein
VTLVELQEWIASADYSLSWVSVPTNRIRILCNRCSFSLEQELIPDWVPRGALPDTYFIPPLTAWNLGIHMGAHVAPRVRS